MNVILLDKVENLGDIGDLVTVKPGYGRNYLLPSGKASLAAAGNLRNLRPGALTWKNMRTSLRAISAPTFSQASATMVIITDDNGHDFSGLRNICLEQIVTTRAITD